MPCSRLALKTRQHHHHHQPFSRTRKRCPHPPPTLPPISPRASPSLPLALECVVVPRHSVPLYHQVTCAIKVSHYPLFSLISLFLSFLRSLPSYPPRSLSLRRMSTPHSSLLTPYCSLLTAHCSLLTAHCSLLTAHCSLQRR